MSNVWYTSDLHIGHAKVIAERAEMAGITTLPPGHPEKAHHENLWHNRVLAGNWDRLVDDEDVIWVLGDISSGKAADQNAALWWIANRPGRKRLILGNHDGPHPKHRDAHKWHLPYASAFEHVSTSARIRIPKPNGHLTALLSHYPYVGDHSVTDRDTQWRLKDEGVVLLHGHTHSTEKVSHGRIGSVVDLSDGLPRVRAFQSTQIHVGVDAWDLRPVSLSEVAELVDG